MREVNQPHPHTLPSALRELDGATRGPSSGRSRSPKRSGSRICTKLDGVESSLSYGRRPGLHHTSATVATTRSPDTKEFSDNGLRYIDLGETLDDINS